MNNWLLLHFAAAVWTVYILLAFEERWGTLTAFKRLALRLWHAYVRSFMPPEHLTEEQLHVWYTSHYHQGY